MRDSLSLSNVDCCKERLWLRIRRNERSRGGQCAHTTVRNERMPPKVRQSELFEGVMPATWADIRDSGALIELISR